MNDADRARLDAVTADDWETMIADAIAAHDFDGAVVLLKAMAVRFPDRASVVLATIQTAMAVRS